MASDERHNSSKKTQNARNLNMKIEEKRSRINSFRSSVGQVRRESVFVLEQNKK
jgi:hypothetical protein